MVFLLIVVFAAVSHRQGAWPLMHWAMYSQSRPKPLPMAMSTWSVSWDTSSGRTLERNATDLLTGVYVEYTERLLERAAGNLEGIEGGGDVLPALSRLLAWTGGEPVARIRIERHTRIARADPQRAAVVDPIGRPDHASQGPAPADPQAPGRW